MVNQQFVNHEMMLYDGDEVVFFPSIAGGLYGSLQLSSNKLAITAQFCHSSIGSNADRYY
jgi:hypothetical protein